MRGRDRAFYGDAYATAMQFALRGGYQIVSARMSPKPAPSAVAVKPTRRPKPVTLSYVKREARAALKILERLRPQAEASADAGHAGRCGRC